MSDLLGFILPICFFKFLCTILTYFLKQPTFLSGLKCKLLSCEQNRILASFSEIKIARIRTQGSKQK